MSKKSIFFCGAALIAGTVSAQKLVDGYITMPESGSLHTYVNAWNGGNGKITMNGSTWEDEEFFISRVKPKARFYNTATQVRPDLTQWSTSNQSGKDKRYLNWVPINDPAFNAIPNGIWDQEVFSMWSYVDHYGDWTSPFGWVPGAFADVAHKNGVAVSGVASVPNSAIPSGWSTCFNGIVSAGAEKVGKFLYYHGVDGLGYNSEWSGYSPVNNGLTNLHIGLRDYMADKNPIWENIWYNGVTDNGGLSFDYEINQSNAGELMKGTSMFMNYNWNSTTKMTNGIAFQKNNSRSPFMIYAGMDQQGGQPKSGENYSLLKDYQYSIGLWGAHSCNMFWEGRGNYGTTVEATQTYYLDITEKWYTGWARNPAVKKAVTTVRNHRPNASWAGISAMMSARSVLNWDIADEPFYSYFNLGNGKFFNWMGERVSDNQWYSIALQDYLPTWRYWFAPEFLQTTVDEGSTGLDATFTWDDAYFGGSCMQITGSASEEYLHLFKTNFIIDNQQIITVRYKLLDGEGNVSLIMSPVNDPTKADEEMMDGATEFLTVATSEAAIDKSYNGEWCEATFEVGGDFSGDDLLDHGVGVIALRFTDAKNMKLLLGEISIKGDDSATPVMPQILSTKVLSNNMAGVDGKIIWKMANSKAVGEPCYNSDVNVSMFKVYAQEEGGPETFVGATTSWAAIAFRSPNTDGSKKIRFGVSAVSMDTKSESAIAWGNYLSKGTYVPSNDIEIDKAIIKPNEAFTCRYVDPLHASSKWTIVNAAGTTVAEGNGVELSVPEGLAQGGYDLYLDKGTANERQFGYFVQITSEEIGALPVVYTMQHNGTDVAEGAAKVEIELTDTPTLSYTGRPADGSASRCVALASRYIGANIGDLGISSGQSLSVAGWFKFRSIPDKTWNFMNISNKAAQWPQNTWGWAWNAGHPDGTIECVFRGAASDSGSPGELHYNFPDTKFQAGIWTHIAWICDYTTAGFRCQLYINGVKQTSRVYQYAYGNKPDQGARSFSYGGKTVNLNWQSGTFGVFERLGNTDGDTYIYGQNYAVAATDRVYFGGAAHTGSAIDGIVDDFQVWNKAMTADDVKKSMNGLDPDDLPAEVLALWDFEVDTASDFSFSAKGSKAGVKAYSYDYLGNAEDTSKPMEFEAYEPVFEPGCPFLSGTAYPVVTEAVWKDTDRKTTFTKAAGSRAAATEGEGGAATVKFNTPGDHTVTLSLENKYGADVKTFPVFSVKDPLSAIEDIDADGSSLNSYTVDNVLFLEFGADGNYAVQVYNTAGMLVGSKQLAAVAGQNARITLGAAGVYLVKVTCNGKELRTLKVLSK